MSQSNPVSNPFGAGPGGGSPEAQNPFQIVGGGSQPASSPNPQGGGRSPFEAVREQEARREAAGGEPPRGNPFQVASGEAAAAAGGQAANPQAGGGFEMKGFPAGSGPVNQIDAAPVGESAEAATPSLDPFAGMDLAQGAKEESKVEAPTEREPKAEEVADFSAPERPATEARHSEPAPAREEAPAERTSFQPAKPSGSSRLINSETRQLELRAIFGVDHELDSQEMLQKARSLPGILHVAKASAKESAALDILQGCTAKLGLDEDAPVVMSCPDGFIDFVTYEDTSLAILRKEDYAPGVRETLIIVARELNKL